MRAVGGGMRGAGLLVALALAGCTLASAQRSQLEAMESCADRQDTAYLAMRDQVATLMVEQGMDLSEALTGLEAAAKIRTIRGASLSSEDAAFLKSHGIFGMYTVSSFSPERFAALRTCLEQRHGMKIRIIEVRAP
jgi:hypothetical protein